jgi:hypothetical protein
MSRRNNQDQKAQLALAMAGGTNVAAWAMENNVPKTTAYRWSRSTEVVKQVADIRSAVVDRVIGRLTDNAVAAVEEIGRLARNAGRDSVRLQAARAVVGELITVSNYATLSRGRLRLVGLTPLSCVPVRCPHFEATPTVVRRGSDRGSRVANGPQNEPRRVGEGVTRRSFTSAPRRDGSCVKTWRDRYDVMTQFAEPTTEMVSNAPSSNTVLPVPLLIRK